MSCQFIHNNLEFRLFASSLYTKFKTIQSLHLKTLSEGKNEVHFSSSSIDVILFLYDRIFFNLLNCEREMIKNKKVTKEEILSFFKEIDYCFNVSSKDFEIDPLFFDIYKEIRVPLYDFLDTYIKDNYKNIEDFFDDLVTYTLLYMSLQYYQCIEIELNKTYKYNVILLCGEFPDVMKSEQTRSSIYAKHFNKIKTHVLRIPKDNFSIL